MKRTRIQTNILVALVILKRQMFLKKLIKKICILIIYSLIGVYIHAIDNQNLLFISGWWWEKECASEWNDFRALQIVINSKLLALESHSEMMTRLVCIEIVSFFGFTTNIFFLMYIWAFSHIFLTNSFRQIRHHLWSVWSKKSNQRA
jgi:hypothetical protein